jgi:hypothetical protein
MSTAVIAALSTAIVAIIGAISAAIVAIKSNGTAKHAADTVLAHIIDHDDPPAPVISDN